MKRIIFIFLLTIPMTIFSQESFSTGTFERLQDYQLMGSAKIVGGDIQLTSSDEWLVGACWYKKKLEVEYGFEVEFQMIINQNGGWRENGADGADGLAFVISNDPKGMSVGEPGEGIGYQGMSNCLVVEFDTFNNFEGGNNHISIQTNGKGRVERYNEQSLAINHKIPELQNTVRKVKIAYDFKDMRVYIDDKLFIKKTVHLEKILKLDKGKAWIGFTAATAGAYSQHKILNLKFKKDTQILVNLENMNKGVGRVKIGRPLYYQSIRPLPPLHAILKEQETFLS
jgi:hypothetical protein